MVFTKSFADNRAKKSQFVGSLMCKKGCHALLWSSEASNLLGSLASSKSWSCCLSDNSSRMKDLGADIMVDDLEIIFLSWSCWNDDGVSSPKASWIKADDDAIFSPYYLIFRQSTEGDFLSWSPLSKRIGYCKTQFREIRCFCNSTLGMIAFYMRCKLLSNGLRTGIICMRIRETQLPKRCGLRISTYVYRLDKITYYSLPWLWLVCVVHTLHMYVRHFPNSLLGNDRCSTMHVVPPRIMFVAFNHQTSSKYLSNIDAALHVTNGSPPTWS